MGSTIRLFLTALTVYSLAGEIAAAQISSERLGVADQTPIQQLLDEVRSLRARVETLEASLALRSAPSIAQAVEPAHVHAAVAEEPAVEAESAHSQHSFLSSPLLSFHGYADLGYSAGNPSSGTSTFHLGQADLFLTSRLSDKLSFLMETALDSDNHNTPGIDVERIFLTYRHNQFLNVDIGRYHTALGYFNGAFHHGRWFQTAADRPFLFEFEDGGGVLPIHNVGVSVSGKIPSGSLNLQYVAETGNGRAFPGPEKEPVQTVRDENNGKSLNFALFAAPRFARGWQWGASFYRDRLTPEDSRKIEQRIYTAHAVYIRDRIEFLNEGVLMHHQTVEANTARVTTVPGFYSQFSYRLASGRPYVRLEYMNAAGSDPVVSPILGNFGFRRAITGGYRFDIAEFCALKFQMETVRRRDLPSAIQGTVQLSFAF